MNAPGAPKVPPTSPINPPQTPQEAQGGASAPQVAPVPPEVQNAVTAAESAYRASLALSPEELSTQEDLDRLVEATKKGYEQIKGQTIAMPFITGQLKSVEERAINLAEPLERKLARMQAARQSSMEASKFALERSDKKAESAQSSYEKAKTEAESSRRYGIEQTQKERDFSEKQREFDLQQKAQAARDAQTKANSDREYSLSVQKFNEDKRQFGLDYANDQRKIAVDEMKAKADAGLAPGEIGQTAGEALQLINDILPNVPAIAGAWQGEWIPFTESAATGSKRDQLADKLTVDARKMLKGQGTITDWEGKMLEQSATILKKWGQSEETIDQELKKIRGTINGNAGLLVDVDIIKDGQVVDTGKLGREDIYDAASQGYTIKYK
jgi:hypothetical protein